MVTCGLERLNVYHFSCDITLGYRKSNSSCDTIVTLGFTSPWVIGVGYGVFGVSTCSSYTNYNVIYIYY